MSDSGRQIGEETDWQKNENARRRRVLLDDSEKGYVVESKPMPARQGQGTSPNPPTTEQVADALRSVYPHGHQQFLPITIAEIKLHSDKNHDYAKGGSSLGNFERVAAILGLYPSLSLADPRVVAIVYLMKQLDAVLWGLNQHITHRVEGANSRLQDISVYTKIIECMNLDMGQAGVGDSMKEGR